MSDAQLRLAVEILGPLVDEVVFVGGATIHLWLTDDAAPPARATDDVDVICDVTTRAATTRLENGCANGISSRCSTSQ